MEEEKKEIIEVENVNHKEVTVSQSEGPKTEVKKEEPKKERKGFCIAAMVLGIVALVFFCVWYLSIPCAILAIIFGILGIKSIGKGMAIAGVVTGSISLVLWIFAIIFIFVFGVAIGITDALDNDYSHYHNYRNYRNNSWYDYD